MFRQSGMEMNRKTSTAEMGVAKEVSRKRQKMKITFK